MQSIVSQNSPKKKYFTYFFVILTKVSKLSKNTLTYFVVFGPFFRIEIFLCRKLRNILMSADYSHSLRQIVFIQYDQKAAF